jgi:dGTPase
MASRAERTLRGIWNAYLEDPEQLPSQALERRVGDTWERPIADYVSGMTDRFAMDEYRKLFDADADV